jgi:polar amino acid transport system substrate-binding protein
MLNRRDFGTGLVKSAAMRRGGPERPPPQPSPGKEPNLARILRTKKLRLAGFAGEEPYCYKDLASGQWSGFCVAFARDLAAQLGVEVAVSEANWADAITDLHTGMVDLCYGLEPTPQRAMFADFGSPLFYDVYAIIARKGFAPKTWAEINVPGTLVSADTGSAREEAVRRLAGQAAMTGFKTRSEALLAVQSGRVDCFVGTTLLLLSELKQDPPYGELRVPTPHLRAAICPALPYDDDRRFRGVVEAWREDNQETGAIRDRIMAALAKLGITPGDLPPDVSL